MAKETKSPSSHAKAGASKAHMYLSCPGSLWMVEQCPPGLPNKFAEEGTLAHDVAALIAEDAFIKDVPIFEAFNKHAEKLKDSEMEGYVLDYVMFLGKLIMVKKPEIINIEGRFTLDKELEMFGTCDFVMIYTTAAKKKILHVIDFKYGAGVWVDPTDNPQLAFYALAAMKEYGDDIDKVEVGIYQPRIEREEGPYSSVVYNTKDMQVWNTKIISGAKKALEMAKTGKDLEFNPSESACRWCPGKGVCKAHAKYMRGSALSDFDPIDQQKFSPPEIHTLSALQVVKIVDNKKAIEDYLTNVYEFACAMVQDVEPNELQKYLEIHEREKRTFDIKGLGEDVIAEALIGLGITEPYRIEKKLKSLTDLEKELPGSKKKAQEMLEPFTVKIPFGRKLEVKEILPNPEEGLIASGEEFGIIERDESTIALEIGDDEDYGL